MKKIAQITYLLIATTLLVACHPEVRYNNFFDDVSQLVKAYDAIGDTTLLAIRDFYPAIDVVVDVTSNDCIIKEYSNTSKDTVLAIKAQKSSPISIIKVKTGIETGTILLRHNDKKNDNVPLATTLAVTPNGRHIIVKSEITPAKCLIMWQNTVLKTMIADSLHLGEFMYSIPKATRRLNKSCIRIFTYNDNGCGNEIIIPLNNGKVILQPEYITDERYIKSDNKYEKYAYSKIQGLKEEKPNNISLLCGDFYMLSNDPNYLAFMKIYMGEYFITVINDSEETITKTYSLPFDLRTLDDEKEITITTKPHSHFTYNFDK